MKNIDKKLNYIKDNYNDVKSGDHILIKKIANKMERD